MNFQPLSNWFRSRKTFDDEYVDTRIPAALSNDENRLLEENVEAKTKELARKQLDIDENIDRIHLLEDHQKIVQEEIQTIERLLAARRAEKTNEQSYLNIDIVEIRRLERLNGHLDDQLKKFIMRKTHFESEVSRLKAEILKIDSETCNEKEILENLMESMKKRDEEAFYFLRYTREDDIRIKELTNELERLSEKSVKLKRATEEETLVYSILEVELDKIAGTFRRSHSQRQQLIKQWEIILIQMQRKDNDIDKLAQELVQIKIKLRSSGQKLNEQKIFYEREQKNNIITEKLIGLAKHKVKTLKAKQRTLNDNHRNLETEILSLKTVLSNTETQLQRERVVFNELKATLSLKEHQLTKLKQRQEQILDRKQFTLNENITIQEKLSKLETSLVNERKYQTSLNHQFKTFSEHLFQLNNELSSLRKREQQFDINNQTYRNQIQSIRNHIHRLDQQLFKQQELIYHQDFLKQTIERRLNRLLGEKSNEKSSETESKIRQLKNDFEKKKSEHDQLEYQMKVVHEELRIVKRNFDQSNTEKNEFNEKFLQFDLYTNLSDKMMKKLNDEKEDSLVEINLLRVELNHLKDILHNSSETNSTLEQQRIEIQKAMKERRLEVQANTHLFRLRYNDERTKKATISTELAMRITKITKLKQRYEGYAMIINTVSSDEENLLLQAQHIIKSAQMKEDLLKQGDQLEALVMKAETELRALENTVQILKWKNSDVKKTFEKLNESSEKMCEMKELEEHLRAATEQVKIRRKCLKELIDKHKSNSLAELEDEIQRNSIAIADKHEIARKFEDEIDKYHMKIARINQRMKDHDYEEDVDVRVQREMNKQIEQQLISLCLSIGDEHLVDIFERLSEENGRKITIKPSISPLKSEKKSSSSSMKIVPNIVNISIDSSSNSRQSSASSLNRFY
ncbi:unnamed protein product [Adineta ricciae]|uniref:Coiled-coil domain-containing protein 39 n=1 Tax=Adineta ricciae TaxID=249248 RepID=A0A813XBC9_ADIRI|nr:unnamed protein product [Adineta ricciae]CAF1220628.1 unnamed protein product [Adineta ricciae]